MQIVLGYIQTFWCNSIRKCVSQNREKFTKTPYLGVQGHLRPSMLTLLKSSSPVLFMMSSMYVHICNHFHAKRANICKLTSF